MDGKIVKISMLLLALAVLCTAASAADGQRLKLATTSSLFDTKLLDSIQIKFQEKYNNTTLDIPAHGGTGIAIQYGQRGDVDVLLIHDPASEKKFISDGHGLERRCIGYNYFYIVGPEDDPANISGLNSSQAFSAIMEKGKADPAKVKFISRGDGSGTHLKEQRIWKAAGYNYSLINTSANKDWYLDSGSPMGATLQMASEKSAYTLTDMSTFMAYQRNLTVVPLIKGGSDLLNVYVAIAVNPKTHPGVNCEMANNFINYLTSDEGQQLIADFGKEKYGQPLFFAAKGNCELIGCSSAECAVPTNASCAAA